MADPKEQAAIRRAMSGIDSPCIVELGAHTGEDETWLREACIDAYSGPGAVHYVMVEPDPRNCQFILDRQPTSRVRRLIIGAVANQDGEALFHMSDNERTGDHGSGSLLEPTGHKTGMPWIKFDRSTWVPTYSLDSLFDREWLSKIDLLWTDLQGSEKAMLAGGKEALRHTRYLFMEVENVELYAGQALKPELIELAAGHGFEVVEEFEYNILLMNGRFRERGPR